MSIGSRIKQLVDSKNMKQNLFAEKLNVKPTTLNTWIKEGATPSINMLKRIIDITKCNAEWLLFNEGEPFSTVKECEGFFAYLDVLGAKAFDKKNILNFYEITKEYSLEHLDITATLSYSAIFETLLKYNVNDDDYDDDYDDEVYLSYLKDDFRSYALNFTKKRPAIFDKIVSLFASDMCVFHCEIEKPKYKSNIQKQIKYACDFLVFASLIASFQHYTSHLNYFWRGAISVGEYIRDDNFFRILGQAPNEVGIIHEKYSLIGTNYFESVDDIRLIVKKYFVEEIYNMFFYEYNLPQEEKMLFYNNIMRYLTNEKRFTLPWFNPNHLRYFQMRDALASFNIGGLENIERYKTFDEYFSDLKKLPANTKSKFENTIKYYESYTKHIKIYDKEKKNIAKLYKWLGEKSTFDGEPKKILEEKDLEQALPIKQIEEPDLHTIHKNVVQVMDDIASLKLTQENMTGFITLFCQTIKNLFPHQHSNLKKTTDSFFDSVIAKIEASPDVDEETKKLVKQCVADSR